MYEIVTEASSNLTGADQTANLTVLPFGFVVNGENFISRIDMPEEEIREHYARMRKKQQVKTSQINLSVFTEAFDRIALEGKDILFIGMSSGISGTYRQAELAAEEMREKYPDRLFLTVDSKNAGFAVGNLVHLALSNREAGMSVSENAEKIEETVPHMRGVFVVDDLGHLYRTGRVSGVVALAGSLLGIKPLLKGDDTGHIVITGKARGKRAALDTLAREMKEHILPQKQTVYISHCDAENDANYLAEQIRDNSSVENVRIALHEPLTGSHLGPGSVALFYLADCR